MLRMRIHIFNAWRRIFYEYSWPKEGEVYCQRERVNLGKINRKM